MALQGIFISETSSVGMAYAISRLEKAVKEGIVNPDFGTLTVQARLLVKHAMGITPPMRGPNAKTPSNGSRNVGVRRVTRDINRLFHTPDADEITHPWVKKIIRTGTAMDWAKFARSDVAGKFSGTTAVVPDAATHKRFRNSRGRVAYISKRSYGMIVLREGKSALAALIKKKVAMVGWARAGWLRGYVSLGGNDAPDWVNRHFPGDGTFTDGRRNPDNPFVEIYNRTDWAFKHDEADRITRTAYAGRFKAIQSYINTMGRLASEGKNPFQIQQALISQQFFGGE